MSDYESVIEAESARFLDAVMAADPAAPVPTCGDWTASDLLWHLTDVHAYWAGILASGAVTDEESEQVEAAKPERPADRAATAELFREQTSRLLAELARHADDEEPAYFWLDTARRVGSTRRMQAHEATMHRVDAELAAGRGSVSIDPELALDGIRHGVEVMWAWWGTLPGFVFVPEQGVVELVADDLGRGVLAQPGRWQGVGQSGTSYDEPGAVLVSGAEPSATVRGSAEQLYRWLWGRGGQPTLAGSDATLAAFLAARDQGMQ
jgi:uncharacterized protein (TIGR03083 family)